MTTYNPRTLNLYKWDEPVIDKWAPSREVRVKLFVLGTLESAADAVAIWLHEHAFETTVTFEEAACLTCLGSTPPDSGDVRDYVPVGKVIAADIQGIF